MRKKHSYRSVDVKTLSAQKLLEQLRALVVVIAIDVAKSRQVAAFVDPTGQAALLCHFEHPAQTPLFLDLVESLKQEGKTVQVALEPTGTYGDVLAHQCLMRGAEVYRVSPKKTHDAQELYDGVPSQHDGKDATLIGRLHLSGLSQRFVPRSEQERTLRALVDQRELYAAQAERLQGQLEALRARYFPEFEQHLDTRKQTSALKVLMQYPSPQQMTQDPAGVQALLVRQSRGRLSADKVQGLLGAAKKSLGVPMLEAEQALVSQVAGELSRLEQQQDRLGPALEATLCQMPWTRELVATLGVCTTAVLIAYLGDLRAYGSVGALEKACGLNLKVSSSGRDSLKKHPPGLHITKRGPGMVRKYLYLATLRWLQQDAVAVAWYQRRSGYSEASKQRAVVALMRKLVAKLWHLSRGAEYCPQKLFDLSRLCPSKALGGGSVRTRKEPEVHPVSL